MAAVDYLLVVACSTSLFVTDQQFHILIVIIDMTLGTGKLRFLVWEVLCHMGDVIECDSVSALLRPTGELGMIVFETVKDVLMAGLTLLVGQFGQAHLHPMMLSMTRRTGKLTMLVGWRLKNLARIE